MASEASSENLDESKRQMWSQGQRSQVRGTGALGPSVGPTEYLERAEGAGPLRFPSWSSLIKPLAVVKRDDKVLIRYTSSVTQDVCHFDIRLKTHHHKDNSVICDVVSYLTELNQNLF